jgi:hypothetical protein
MTVGINDGATIITAPTTSGIVEFPAGSGVYTATLTAPTVEGQYLVVWNDGTDTRTEDLTVSGSVIGGMPPATGDLSSIRPTVEDVGLLESARTYVMGTPRNTFDEDTIPTGAQVEMLIDLALGDMQSRVGSEIGDVNDADARRLVALQTASMIEASFFPDSLDSDRSAYRQYQAMYLGGIERMTGLNEDIAII